MRRPHVGALAAAARDRTPDAVLPLVLGLVLLAVLAAVATATGGLAAASDADAGVVPDDLPPPDSYAAVQGARCTDVSPVTGAERVESAHDYRNPYPDITGNPADSSYSAFGFREYQAASASTLFVYRGPAGDSLVLLHGELDAPGENGSTAQFTFDGLPRSGEWAVQDDEYPNRDDDWTVGRTTTTVDWVWGPERTDGGAFRGIENTSGAVRIDPQFNEAAPRWRQWRHSGSPENRVDRWRVVTDDGRTVLLSMDEPLYLAPSSCDDLPTANASITATPGDVPRDRTVTLSAEASGPGADLPVLEYRWDLTGDGTVDRVTETPTVEHRYTTAGQYRPAVRVRTAAGTSEPAATSVGVGQSDAAAVSVTGVEADDGVAGEPTTLTVQVVNDGGGGGTVDLTARGNGEVVGERTVEVGPLSSTSVEMTVTYPDPGEYDVSVAGATTTVRVAERDPDLRVESLTAPERVVAGRSVTLAATVTNDGNAPGEFAVELERAGSVVAERTVSLDPDETVEVEFDHAVEDPGNHTLTVGERTAEVEVVGVDPELSVASIETDGPVDAGASTAITVVVENTGNAASTFEVPLELFGEVVAVETVSLDPGERTTVSFPTTIDEPGTYTARVGNRTTELTVVGSNQSGGSATATPAGESSPLPGPSLVLTGLAVLALVAAYRHRADR